MKRWGFLASNATVVALSIVLGGCATTTAAVVKTENETSKQEFVPIEPLPADQVTYYKNGVKVTEPWSSIDEKLRRALLPIHSSHTVIQKLDVKGSANYLTASVSGEAGSYRVLMDFMKCRVEEVPPTNGTQTLSGYQRVGIGLRVRADVVTTKANVNLGSLMALGIAAHEGSARGELSIEVIGIDSSAISQIFPMPSQIDETSIQKVLEAAASIKSKIGDDQITLTPHIVALRTEARGPQLENVKANLHTSSASTTPSPPPPPPQQQQQQQQ